MNPSRDFSTRGVVQIVHRLVGDFNNEKLKDWIKQGVLPAEPVGRGVERVYAFQELAVIAALAFVAPHARYGGLFEAYSVAKDLASLIVQIYQTGPDGDVAEALPILLLVYDGGTLTLQPVTPDGQKLRSVARNFAWRGAVIVHAGQMALALDAAIQMDEERRKAQ